MKKIVFLIVLMFLLFPTILAINISVEKQAEEGVMIPEIERPVVFDLKITNNGPTDNFKFYNLLGFTMLPDKPVEIKKDATEKIQLKIYPRENFKQQGFYIFQFYIQGKNYSEIGDKLTIKIIELGEAFEVGSGEFDSESSSVDIYIKNKENIDFENMSAKFSSAFFNFEEKFSLSPKEEKTFNVNLNREDFKKLIAGFYTLDGEVEVDGKKANVEGIIKFVEKELITSKKRSYGFPVYTEKIIKTNEGNVIVESETTIKKNIISRLFTSLILNQIV